MARNNKNARQRLFTVDTRRGMISLLMLFAAAALIIWLCRPVISRLSGLGLPCLLRFFTGLNCPFCGGTRCALALMDFDIITAFYYNPPVVIAAALLAVYLLCCLFACLQREYRPINIKLRSNGVYILLAAVLIFFIVRNLPFYRAIFY